MRIVMTVSALLLTLCAPQPFTHAETAIVPHDGAPDSNAYETLLIMARAGDLAPLDQDREGLARAVRSLAEAGDAPGALELVGRTWRIWLGRGELNAGRAAAASALAAPGADRVAPWRCRVLYADGLFAFRAGDRNGSLARNEEALRIARENEDVRCECEALTGLARVALRDGDYVRVVTLAEEGRTRAETAGDPALETAPLHLHAAGVRLQGHYVRARELYLTSRDLNRRLGNREWVAMEEHNLGWVELHLADADAAEAHFSAIGESGDTNAYGKAWSELNRAGLACARGQLDQARPKFDAGAKALREIGAVLDPDDQAEYDWLGSRLAHHCK